MKIQHLTVFVCLFCIGLASCSHAQNQKKEAKKFRLPDVPVTLTAPEDRADYLSLHYWDHFDFADTSLISPPRNHRAGICGFHQRLALFLQSTDSR